MITAKNKMQLKEKGKQLQTKPNYEQDKAPFINKARLFNYISKLIFFLFRPRMVDP